MFGHVIVHKDELKVKEYSRYQSFYCGLCKTLGERHGVTSKLALSYDLTFLALLLTGLYEPESTKRTIFCAVHPTQKKSVLQNPYMDYAADMTILLMYEKLIDDWKDDRSVSAKAFSMALKNRYRKVVSQYPLHAAAIQQALQRLGELEDKKTDGLDACSAVFGEIMARLFVIEEDVWSPTLARLGMFLGKFIYLADAYVDLEADRKSGAFNPLIQLAEQADFESYMEQHLNLIMEACAREFEHLPIVEDAELLRNIIYAGVWTKYYQTRTKRQEKSEEKK